MAVEIGYPCAEMVVAGYYSFGVNFFGSLFLFFFLIPGIGKIFYNNVFEDGMNRI